jgi:hypothetical protein
MAHRRPRSSLSVGLFVTLTVGLLPGVVSAHSITGTRFDAPIPLWLLLVGAGVTVAATALWMAYSTDSTPSTRRRTLLTVPSSVARPLRYLVSGLFLLAVLAVLVFGVVGRQVPAENVATVFVWPVWFRGVALLAILFGSPWPTLSPWETVYDGLLFLEGRAVAFLGTYPTVLGAWPALLGFLGLVGITETLTVVPRSPRLTTAVVAAYGLLMVVGAVCFGRPWLRRADPLAVFYRLFGRVAPLAWFRTDDGGYTVALRPPWQGCLSPVESVPVVVFVVAMVYTVSFDGFTNLRAFQTVLFATRDALGTGPGTAVMLYAVGLGVFVATFALGGWAVERLGRTSDRDTLAAMFGFAPTVLPIAAAYEIAHNYPYVIRNLGELLGIVVGPIAPGVGSLDPLGWLSLPVFWGSQIVLIVFGHVIAVVAAHLVAVDRYGAFARRGHLPLVVLMVGYTVLSLWIISRPVVFLR